MTINREQDNLSVQLMPPDPTPYMDDERLWGLIERKDHQAFSALYLRHSRDLFLLAFSLTDCMVESEDLIQEAFMAVWGRKIPFHENRSFKQYLIQTICNRVHDKRLRHQRWTRIIKHLRPATCVDETVTEKLTLKNNSERLHWAIGKMTWPSARRDMVLFYLGQLSQSEIARITGTSSRVVKNNVYRGLKLLRKIY